MLCLRTLARQRFAQSPAVLSCAGWYPTCPSATDTRRDASISMTTDVQTAHRRESRPHPPQPARVLRWTFRRGDEQTVCELGLDQNDFAYELTTVTTPDQPPSIQRYNDAIAALHDQATLERGLVQAGWSLERFQTEEVSR